MWCGWEMSLLALWAHAHIALLIFSLANGVPSFDECSCQLLWKIPQKYQIYSYFLSMLRDIHCADKAFISASIYPPECTVTDEKQLAALQDQSHSLVTGTCSLPQILAVLLFHSTFYV